MSGICTRRTERRVKKKTVRDIDVAGKRVFVRVDFNVPQDKATRKITVTRSLPASATVDCGIVCFSGRGSGPRRDALTAEHVRA